MATQQTSSREQGSAGIPLWLPLAGVVIAVLIFGLVVVKSSNTRGKVGVSAPAGANPNRMPDEGDVLRARQQGRK